MSQVATAAPEGPLPTGAQTEAVVPGQVTSEADRPGPEGRRRWRPGPIALSGLLLAAGATVALHAPTRERVLRLVGAGTPAGPPAEPATEPVLAVSPPRYRDGQIELEPVQRQTLGIQLATVQAQSEPTRLEISGTLAYDPNFQNQVRPRFTSVVDRVYVNLGQAVKAGDPLVDVFSAELAAAKSDYEKALARWNHDRKELERAEKLFNATPRAMSEREYLSVANDEKVSNAEQKVAADKLIVYGLTPDELQKVPTEVGATKAKMTLRAPADGVVIRKDVVPGNRYDDADVLLVIAQLDHFWVWGNVYPSDASRVRIGQRWVIRSPLLEQDRVCQIESVTSEVANDTKSVRIRSRIDDPDGHLKSSLLVGGYVEIPATAGRTVVPRLALVSIDGGDYVFVARADESTGAASPVHAFQRRSVRVESEYHDRVVIADGLEPGERVVTQGSLILNQIDEEGRSGAGTDPEVAANRR